MEIIVKKFIDWLSLLLQFELGDLQNLPYITAVGKPINAFGRELKDASLRALSLDVFRSPKYCLEGTS